MNLYWSPENHELRSYKLVLCMLLIQSYWWWTQEPRFGVGHLRRWIHVTDWDSEILLYSVLYSSKSCLISFGFEEHLRDPPWILLLHIQNVHFDNFICKYSLPRLKSIFFFKLAKQITPLKCNIISLYSHRHASLTFFLKKVKIAKFIASNFIKLSFFLKTV